MRLDYYKVPWSRALPLMSSKLSSVGFHKRQMLHYGRLSYPPIVLELDFIMPRHAETKACIFYGLKDKQPRLSSYSQIESRKGSRRVPEAVTLRE